MRRPLIRSRFRAGPTKAEALSVTYALIVTGAVLVLSVVAFATGLDLLLLPD